MTQNLPSFLGVNNKNPQPSQQVPVYFKGNTETPYYGILTNEFCASRKLPLTISSTGFDISTNESQNFLKTQLATYPAAYNVYCYPNSSQNPTLGMSVFSTTLYLLVINTEIIDSKGKPVYFNLNQVAAQDNKVRESLSKYRKDATSLFCLDIMNANLDTNIFTSKFLENFSLPIDPTTFTSIQVPQVPSKTSQAVPVNFDQGFGAL